MYKFSLLLLISFFLLGFAPVNAKTKTIKKTSVKATYPICSYDAYNCSNFKTKSEAMKVFSQCGGVKKDVHRLDGDKDGIPCESLK